ncbi:MAG: response regulator transcription factor [Saprospiraceae bacterium]|jgi:two-component system alkaline phosphatase synthesis response regulator PhoP|nr:response regulator transcription factor [Saprospiraceae bacterium]
MTNKYNILAIDDEQDICEIIQFNLEAEGFLVDTVFSAKEALQKPLEDYDLLILDIMMNEMSGLKLADEIRNKRKIDTPIIFLTAKNLENDKLTAFTLGADDYITKPFSLRELIARVKVVLRRNNPTKIEEEAILKISALELDIEKKKLFVDGLKVDLTPHEFYIMELLLKNHGKVFNREKILNYAWRENTQVIERTVDVHMTRLRKKLGIYGKYLVSRSGHGYCLELE